MYLQTDLQQQAKTLLANQTHEHLDQIAVWNQIRDIKNVQEKLYLLAANEITNGIN